MRYGGIYYNIIKLVLKTSNHNCKVYATTYFLHYPLSLHFLDSFLWYIPDDKNIKQIMFTNP